MCVFYNTLNHLLFHSIFSLSAINMQGYYWQDNN